MANIQLLTHPIIRPEALEDFVNALSDRAPEIEKDMARLAKAPTDRVVIADIFRAMHNIKGDAAMCKVEMATQIAHPIESLLTSLRSGELHYSPLMGEVILLAVDRLGTGDRGAGGAQTGQSSETGRTGRRAGGVWAWRRRRDLDRIASQVIFDVTGFRPQPVRRQASLEAPVPDESGRWLRPEFFPLPCLAVRSALAAFSGAHWAHPRSGAGDQSSRRVASRCSAA